MVIKDVDLLVAINFLHSWSHGLTTPIMASHLLLIGGNQVTVGYMITGMFICQNLSRDFLALYEHSTRLSLTFCLFISFLCYLMMATTDSCIIVLLVRWLTALVNSVYTCSKELIAQIEPEENHPKCFYLIDIMRTMGLASGAVAGGYIYNYFEDFECNALLGAISTLIAILILQQMSETGLGRMRQSNLMQLPDVCYEKLKNLSEIDYRSNWDLLLMHVTYIGSFIIFFNKFSLLLVYNYSVGVIIIGYTTAYQLMWLFACNNLQLYVKKNFPRMPFANIFEFSLVVSSITLLGLYYAPSYECYLMIFIPMVISYTIVANCLEDDMKRLKVDEKLFEATQTITVILNIVIPIIFGALYQTIGGPVFKVLSTLLPVVCVYVLNKKYFQPAVVEYEEQERQGTSGRVKED